MEDRYKFNKVQNTFINIRNKLESIGCKVVFVTITTMSFHDWNIHRLKCHKTAQLIFLKRYEEMQWELYTVIYKLNQFITESNEDKNLVTPLMHRYVHKTIGKKCYIYSKLVNGLHPSPALVEKWTQHMIRKIRYYRQCQVSFLS